VGARPSNFDGAPEELATFREWADGQVTSDRAGVIDWSEEQQDIFTEFREGMDPVLVDAVAGSGKTTTIVEGVKCARESNPLVCAFNKKIADTLTERLADTYASAKTLHSLGYGIIRRQWKGMPLSQENERGEQITDEVTKRDKATLPKLIRRLITNMHTKARELHPLTWDETALWEMGGKFDLLPDDQGWGRFGPEYVIEKTAEAMAWATENEPSRVTGIDWADMMFLPLAWDITAKDYDLVVVDERQDMSAAQLDLAQRVCDGRLILVGDKHQAIYGFRGADQAAGERIAAALNAKSLPLTTCYRCDEAVIRDAQRLVPHIRARQDAEEGTVDASLYEDMLTSAVPGDFILSRLNAPLVTATLTLLRNGIRARMAGRDIGQGILKLLRRLKIERATPLYRAQAAVHDWEMKERQRFAARGLLSEVNRVIDTAGMLYAFINDARDGAEMINRIENLFTDELGPYVMTSSVHKAKGLEADRVWLLQESLYRGDDPVEEANIEYVAVTRAKHHLTKVTGVPTLQPKEWER
jgi:superfamily I DNA/RNA helicase